MCVSHLLCHVLRYGQSPAQQLKENSGVINYVYCQGNCTYQPFRGLCCVLGACVSDWVGCHSSPGLLLPGLFLVLGTMAWLSNAVVTSCTHSFSSLHPLFLLGLFQETAAQQERCHLSREKRDLLSPVWSTDWHVLHLICGGSESDAASHDLMGGSPIEAPQVLSAYHQQCCWLLSKTGYFLKHCRIVNGEAVVNCWQAAIRICILLIFFLIYGPRLDPDVVCSGQEDNERGQAANILEQS